MTSAWVKVFQKSQNICPALLDEYKFKDYYKPQQEEKSKATKKSKQGNIEVQEFNVEQRHKKNVLKWTKSKQLKINSHHYAF